MLTARWVKSYWGSGHVKEPLATVAHLRHSISFHPPGRWPLLDEAPQIIVGKWQRGNYFISEEIDKYVVWRRQSSSERTAISDGSGIDPRVEEKIIEVKEINKEFGEKENHKEGRKIGEYNGERRRQERVVWQGREWEQKWRTQRARDRGDRWGLTAFPMPSASSQSPPTLTWPPGIHSLSGITPF